MTKTNTAVKMMEYCVKFKYDKACRNYEEASKDLVNVIFSCINLTSLKNYNVSMLSDEGKYGTVKLTFTTYGRKLDVEDILYNEITYDYKLYIDELDIVNQKESFHTINKDSYGIGYNFIESNEISYCPHCEHRIFKFNILEANNEAWAFCKNCHDIIKVNR